MEKVFKEIETLGDTEERRAQLKTAFYCDYTEQTGETKGDSSKNYPIPIAKALEAYASPSKQGKRLKRKADLLMALNWGIGKDPWCWKPLNWIAAELNKSIPGLNLSRDAVKQRRDALGLISHRSSGPVPGGG